LNELKVELKSTEMKLIKKDYEYETTKEKFVTILEELAESNLELATQSAKLKEQQEKLQALEKILDENLNLTPPTGVPGIFSKSAYLEKQLDLKTKAELACQTRNAYLSAEVSRLENQLKTQNDLNSGIIYRVKKESEALRKKNFLLTGLQAVEVRDEDTLEELQIKHESLIL